MKRISVFLAFLMLLMLAFSSCRKNDSAPQNSGSGSGGGENIPSEDTGDEEWYYSSDKEIRIVHSLGLDDRASEIGEAIFEASGLSVEVCTDSGGEREYEIVIGECNRAVSKEAYSLLMDKIEKDERDSGYLIYSDGSSIALAYIGRAEEILQEEAVNFFIESCVYEDFVLSSGTLCYYGFDLIEELDERDELIAELQMIRLSLRDLMVLKQSENAALCFFASREEALNLSDSFTTPKLLKLCDGLELACDKLHMNANVRLTLTAFAVENGLL
jgi:hypothetical protein